MHKVRELAELTGGVVIGDADRRIEEARPFESAGPESITLAAGRKYLANLEQTEAGCVIIGSGFQLPENPSRTYLQVDNPRLAFAQIRTHLEKHLFQAEGVSPLAAIAPDATIDGNISIHPFVRVGKGSVVESEVTLHSGVVVGEGCHIGAGTVIFPNVTLYDGTRLGRRVRIHSGSVIGADGFGYIFDGEKQFKVPQSGSVEIGDDVEIGANCSVDRATFGSTVLESGVKLDNLVHIGHNCRLGEHTVVVGCVGISGSVQIGKRCVLAGQVGIVDHVTIGDDVTAMGKTVISRDVPSGSVISGPFGRDHREQLRIEAALRRLPDLLRDVRRIKALLESTESSGGNLERE